MAKELDLGKLPPPKPRTQVPEQVAERFADPTPPPPEAPAKERKASKLRAAVKGERINAYIDPALVQGMREVAFRERRSLSDAMAEAVSQWIERKQTKV